jgi:predicted restriction endonuclease
MTRSEVLSTFTNVNCARIDAGFAPHKPITILLLLEMVASGHENQYSYREFDSNLRRLLERYGSPSAADARNEPFWRLKNDGILEVTAPFSLLVESAMGYFSPFPCRSNSSLMQLEPLQPNSLKQTCVVQ